MSILEVTKLVYMRFLSPISESATFITYSEIILLFNEGGSNLVTEGVEKRRGDKDLKQNGCVYGYFF